MAYTKQTWVDNQTPADASHMNHIEEGIENVTSVADVHTNSISTLQEKINNLEALYRSITEVHVETLEYSSDFTGYSGDINNPKIIKSGNVVQITGIAKPTAEIAAGQITTMFQIPEGLRPSVNYVKGVMQGSYLNRWCLAISPDTGNVTVERYGTTTNSAIPATAWLPFSITYVIENGE